MASWITSLAGPSECTGGRTSAYVLAVRPTNAQCLQPSSAYSAFLDTERDHAAGGNHLTAAQVGEIARRIGAKAVAPFHFSPRYEHRGGDLVAEVQAAWRGAPTTVAGA
jgi:hypothetical protein